MPICQNCGKSLDEHCKFCSECGMPIPQKKNCPRCATELPFEAKFCHECGFNFNATQAEAKEDNTFTDPRDGQTYKTVKIGNQVWLAENFRYRCEGSYVYKNDAANLNKYGCYYTWNAAMKCAPKGWHLPTEEEFDILESYVNAHTDSDVGTALKATQGWKNFVDPKGRHFEAIQGSDEFGFNALPAGCSSSGRCYIDQGSWTRFWSSSVCDYGRVFIVLNSSIGFSKMWIKVTESIFDDVPLTFDFSVRLIKD